MLFIAEAGVNHNGDLARAKSLIDAAVLARADAVKFQTYRAERLVTADAPKADYQKRTTGGGESQAAMLKKLELSFEAFRELAAYCRAKGILFLSTPFDEESADFLLELGVPAFKIGSGDLTNLPFLEHVARKGLPMIVSTGMADLSDVEAAVQTLRRAGNSQIILLHCVSAYPADPATVNLRAMATLTRRFGVPVGFSDHTRGSRWPWEPPRSVRVSSKNISRWTGGCRDRITAHRWSRANWRPWSTRFAPCSRRWATGSSVPRLSNATRRGWPGGAWWRPGISRPVKHSTEALLWSKGRERDCRPRRSTVLSDAGPGWIFPGGRC